MRKLPVGMMLVLALRLAASAWNQQESPGGSQRPSIVRVSQGVMKGNLLRQVDPLYPPEVRAKHIQGDVLLRINIDRSGNVSVVKVELGSQILADAAMEAVKQWKYRPMTLNGEAVTVETTVKIRFQL